ncbi:MAG TPA: N,N-dimethylformamidase beta subunit family domain-containing protein [Gaiellaceae bacterium]|nr:N,N-dimethylformamidase beta subunit family domain-containing protein [Gaiellaceae bacterium]
MLGLAGAAGAWMLAHTGPAQALSRQLLGALRVRNGGAPPFAGDGPQLTTVSLVPGRNVARIEFTLARRAHVSLNILETGQGVASEQPSTVAETSLRTKSSMLAAGTHVLEWEPAPTLAPRTYIARVTAQASGAAAQSRDAVVRVLGVDAAFSARSVAPGDPLTLVVRTDARQLTVQMLHSGPESVPTYANDLVNGVAVGAPIEVDWTAHTNAPAPIVLATDPSWQSGVYFAQLTADDGRIGFAPVIVRPSAPSSRVAVVMPTSTWTAYNFYDADGDGWGDTWYARWKTKEADLTRPNPQRGVPYRYRSYDLQFQHWLNQTGKVVDTWADEDIELFASPQALRAAYDLIVFPGHTEYVTTRLYDLIEAYRDLGGNLMFLSANNFFRRVDRAHERLTLIDEWRNLGRPESALLGVEYVASDRGQRHAPFTVVGADAAPWVFDGTGLGNGAQFGTYGIEIDARSAVSPSSTIVLANIPNLFPGKTAEMTYYEHWSGAQVFSAGALNFGGQVMLWPQSEQILTNVWNRLAPSV